MQHYMRRGAGYGLLVWGAYAAAEVAMVVVRPLVAGHQQLVLRSHWEFLAVSTVAYLLAGALFGALAGWVGERFRPAGGDAPVRLAVLTLVIAFTANAAAETDSWNATNAVALGLGAFLLAAAAAGLLRPGWLRWTRPFADPWAVALLLVGAPLTAPIFNPWKILALGVAVTVAFLGSTTVLDRGRGRFPKRQGIALVISFGAMFVSIPAFVQPLETPSPPNANGARASRPNVVLVVMDTVRADHLSLYGYDRDTTPGLRRLAGKATLYRHCVAPSNYTLSSHASMFTGLYPRSHGAINLPPGASLGEPLDTKFETLAERLAAQGYLNLAVVANFGYLRPEFGLDQGFHVYDVRQPVACLPPGKRHLLRYGLRRLLQPLVFSEKFDQKYRNAREINETVFSLLDSATRANAPFFLFVNYMDAHDPYLPPPPYNRLFEGRDEGLTAEYFLSLRYAVAAGERRISDVERRHYMSQYDGAIAYLDAQIERLVERLVQLKQFENTILVVTSDHGEAFEEHGHIGHGWTVHQEETWVPLLIKYSGQRVGAVSDAVVSLVDLTPTLLMATGGATVADGHGVDLSSPRIGDNARSIFIEAYLSAGRILNDRVKHPLLSWAVVSPERLKTISASDGRQELYDLRVDPFETGDLHSVRRLDSHRLLAELERWKQQFPVRASARRPVGQSTLERLKSLGYVR
jgi:arylsulfatase A-like enzyme